MKFAEMMQASIESLGEHYRGIRKLALNNSKLAQNGYFTRTNHKLLNQMEYLMRQINMVETACKKRNIPLSQLLEEN